MKICFVIPTLTGGGAERVAVTVLSALSRHERTLYLFSDADAVYLDRVAPDVRVVVASKRGWLPRMLELARYLHASRPDVVMGFLSFFITAIAAWVAGGRARVVFNQQTPVTEFLDDPDFAWRRPWRRRLFAVMTRWFYGRADAVVVTSAGVGDDLATRYGVPRSSLRVLHNPVDLDAIATAAAAPIDEPRDAPPVVAAAGRLAGVKNFPLLLEAIARLEPVTRSGGTSVPPAAAHAWILGDGAERDRLQGMARALGIAERVRFLGFQSNPWRFMARADVFVLTSTYEGFGNVLIEAMACGVPVVATRSPGTIEIIEHEVNGLLVDHDAASVAAALARVLGDDGLGRRLRDGGQAQVQQYAVPRVARRYEQLFEELAA